MNFKAFFITDDNDSQPWIKAKNLFSILPEEIQNSIEKIDKAKFNDLDGFNLELKPIGLINQLYMSLNPSSTEKYLTHYLIYKKVIEEDIDCCMIFEDEVVFSDVINLFFVNPDMPEDIDIANLSTEGIKNLNAYYLTNKGAKNILDKIQNSSWLNSMKRFQPSDYGLSNEALTLREFTAEPLQDFSVQNQIIAPIEKIILTACQYSKISSRHNISFIHSISNYNTFEVKNELKDLSQEKLTEIVNSKGFKFWEKRGSINNSSIDCIFYINLDQDTSKMTRIESMLEQINLPFERFSAIKPNRDDISLGGQYRKVYNKSKILEARAYFSETLDYIDLEKYQLGTLGCYLSHYKLLQRIYEMKDFMNYVIIIEDDCYMNQETIIGLENILKDLNEWDIIRSTWAAPKYCHKVNYSHPLSNYFEPSMQKNIFNNIRRVRNDYPSLCPIINTFCGGTHFQVINVESIPKILEHLDSEVLIPIDSLYHSTKLNIYNIKMNVSHDIFASSSICVKNEGL